MARIKLLNQVALLEHQGDYTIGLAISNNDMIKLENSFINADFILSNYDPNETNLNARVILKGLLEGLDNYKMWKNKYLAENIVNPIPSSIFLVLPTEDCNVNLGIKTNDDLPSQMMYFSIEEVNETAKSLRRAYDLADNYDLMDAINGMSGLLESFESFITAMNENK